jgi:hypothetical protein
VHHSRGEADISSSACNGEAESNMKIDPLVMLMSALLMAIRFTTAQQQSNSPQAPLSQTSTCAGSFADRECMAAHSQ